MFEIEEGVHIFGDPLQLRLAGTGLVGLGDVTGRQAIVERDEDGRNGLEPEQGDEAEQGRPQVSRAVPFRSAGVARRPCHGRCRRHGRRLGGGVGRGVGLGGGGGGVSRFSGATPFATIEKVLLAGLVRNGSLHGHHHLARARVRARVWYAAAYVPKLSTEPGRDDYDRMLVAKSSNSELRLRERLASGPGRRIGPQALPATARQWWRGWRAVSGCWRKRRTFPLPRLGLGA